MCLSLVWLRGSQSLRSTSCSLFPPSVPSSLHLSQYCAVFTRCSTTLMWSNPGKYPNDTVHTYPGISPRSFSPALLRPLSQVSVTTLSAVLRVLLRARCTFFSWVPRSFFCLCGDCFLVRLFKTRFPPSSECSPNCILAKWPVPEILCLNGFFFFCLTLVYLQSETSRCNLPVSLSLNSPHLFLHQHLNTVAFLRLSCRCLFGLTGLNCGLFLSVLVVCFPLGFRFRPSLIL